MNHAVFNDPALNQQLSHFGFVKIPLLSAHEVNALKDFYSKLHSENPEVFTTLLSENIQYKKQIDTTIKSIFSNSAASLFTSHQPFWGNFFSKLPGSPEMPPHADLQYVDEKEFISLNIWCPLSDTNSANGTLYVVPFSHKLVRQLRGTNATDTYRKHAKAIAEKYGDCLEFKAGEAIIYDHRLLHYSSANSSQETRIAATLVMVPPQAPLRHYYAETEGSSTIYEYSIESADDLINTGFLKKPANILPVEIIQNYKFEPLTVEDFDTLHREMNMVLSK